MRTIRMGSVLRAAAHAALVAVLLSACTAATASNGSTPSPTPTARASGLASPTTSTSSEVAREAASPDPNFDYGFTVQITDDGFHPRWLIAACCRPITWTNLTDRTRSVAFDHLLVRSGPIPPGGMWAFTPANVESIAYHADTGSAMAGIVQVNQDFES